MSSPENPQIWNQVVESTGLRIPEEQREHLEALAKEIQGLMGVLRDAQLRDTPPSFAFRAQ